MCFDSILKRMSVVYRLNPLRNRMGGDKGRKEEGEMTMYTKGAFESVYPLCSHIRVDGRDQLIEHVKVNDFCDEVMQYRVDLMAQRGLRVLAFATRVIPDEEKGAVLNYARADGDGGREELEKGLVFLGFVGLQDPPRRDTPGAVQTCREAGITVRMVTGDHPQTAAALAKQVNILKNRAEGGKEGGNIVMTSGHFDHLSDEALDNMPFLPAVVARCSPGTKVKLIKALHRRGRIVAMTGGEGGTKERKEGERKNGPGGHWPTPVPASDMLILSFLSPSLPPSLPPFR